MSISYCRNTLDGGTDFFDGEGYYIELVRTQDHCPTLVKYDLNAQIATFSPRIELQDRVFVPPEEDELTRHVRFAHYCGGYISVHSLLHQIESFLFRCLDLDDSHRFLLACFVLSTWVADQLPIAPNLAVVGLSPSGKTTALNALHLLCRRSLLVSNISSAAFYRVCDRLMPTVLIDNTATVGPERKLFHFLRSGTTPNIIGSRGSHSYRTFGAKVVSWTELPDDDALNSKCIIIPMQESLRTDLLRTNDPEIVAIADELQVQLLNYRFEILETLALRDDPGAKKLRWRDRDLYEALALPIAEDVEACQRLLECIEQQQGLHNPSLPPNRAALLGTLFQLIHLQPEQGTLLFSDLAKNVNLNLVRVGERFRLTAKGVGKALTSLGLFSSRNRISSGTVGCLDRAARKRIHELVSRYGVDGLADYIPSEKPWERCEFCKVQHPQNAETATTDESTDRITFDIVPPPAQTE